MATAHDPHFPGTGPLALRDLIRSEWRPSRTGRPDLPDVIRDSNGDPSSDPDDASDKGRVLVTNDRQAYDHQRAVFDLIHAYHTEAGPIAIEDRGFKEQNEVETVQIDIHCTDRTASDGTRVDARERMVGSREDESDLTGAGFTLGSGGGGTLGNSDGGTLGDQNDAVAYPGLLGETIYILETKRRGYAEWDKLSYTVVEARLKAASARMSLDVQLERIARNTVV